MDFQTGIAIVFAVIFLLGAGGVVAYLRDKQPELPSREIEVSNPSCCRTFFIRSDEAKTPHDAMTHRLVPGLYDQSDDVTNCLVVVAVDATPTVIGPSLGWLVTVRYGTEHHVTWNQLVVRSDEV